MKKIKKTSEQLLNFFWEASNNCYFTDETVALVLCLEKQTMAKYRCEGKGPKFLKLNGRILYRKQDVLEFVNTFEKNDDRPV
jgi:hypothetical protein